MTWIFVLVGAIAFGATFDRPHGYIIGAVLGYLLSRALTVDGELKNLRNSCFAKSKRALIRASPRWR